MITELLALKDSISTVDGYPTFIVRADSGTTGAYVVLGAKGWESPAEVPLCGPDQTIDTDIRLTATTGTTDGVFKMLAKLRGHLSPGFRESRVTVPDRFVTVRYVRSEFVDVDRDLTIPTTGRHPAFGVDTYNLISQPL